MAVARDAGVDPHRHIVAVIGDGSMTGGMAYEALNNLGHSKRRVIIVLNDNGRSYAPTISNLTTERPTTIGDDGPADTPPLISRIGEWLSHSLTEIRLNPTYVRRQRRLEEFLRDVPVVGTPAERAVEAFKAGVREFLQPPAFFEALGVRYVGPVDGHDVPAFEHALRNAEELSAEGPIVVHVLTTKGRGYAPAEDDEEKHLHDAPVFDPLTGPPKAVPTGYTQAFAEAIIKEAEADSRVVAITAAMAGPTGLLPFQARFPDRFFDVGIAEQHAVTAAAGMAMSGLRPIVAIYSTFLNRAWDQVVYDVALHRLPVVFCLDRAGLTGPDGPSHHGVYDLAMLARVPGMRVLAPSSAQELQAMLHDAMHLADAGPVAIRYPRGRHHRSASTRSASGCGPAGARAADDPADAVCLLAVGKMLGAATKAADRLAQRRGRGDGLGRPLLCAARRGHARRRRRPPPGGDARGRHPGRGHRHAHRRAPAARSAAEVVVLGLPCQFIPHHANPDHLLSQHGLDADGIAAARRGNLIPVTSVARSVLDLSMVSAGMSSAEALAATTELARAAERLGYGRFWVAEHHNMETVASTSPAVLMAHVAASTSSIHVGSGGVMLPNHAPLVIAEQFAMLEALHPGRIDLGIGRAPGTDPMTAAALRRTPDMTADTFPRDLLELMGWLGDDRVEPGTWSRFRATPKATSRPTIMLLGSSDFSARLAGQLGLGFAFAHHFDLPGTLEALSVYRDAFVPSPELAEPYAMVTAGVLAADDDERRSTSPARPVWPCSGSARTAGRRCCRRPRPPPTPTSRSPARCRRTASSAARPPSRDGIAALIARTGADELMVSTMTHGLPERIRTLELVAEHWPVLTGRHGGSYAGAVTDLADELPWPRSWRRGPTP